MKTFVAFFEIPAINMERAVQFYGTVFGEKLEIVEYGEEKMAFISSGDQQPIGCIFSLKGYLPTSNSITISFYTENMDEFVSQCTKNMEYINSSRPTAVNLSWALNRMDRVIRPGDRAP